MYIRCRAGLIRPGYIRSLVSRLSAASRIINKTMPGRLRVSEWIALAYFLYLIALAAVARVSVARRQRVLATAPVTCAAIATIGLQAGTAAALARDWLPLP